MTEQWTRDSVLELSAGFLKARILLSAAELDLFTILGHKASTVDELCRVKGWSPRALTILLDSLAAIGLVVKQPDGVYSVEDLAFRLLGSEGDESVLPMILHRGRMWRTWSKLTDIVKQGSDPNRVDMEESPDEEVEAFIGAMQVIGRDTAERIAGSIDLNGYKNMLDVGGGSGVYTAAFMNKAPQLKATIFDRPRVIEIARERMTDAGLIDRVTLIEGDYNENELPLGHDLALLSAIVHINGHEGNIELYRKIHRALRPGGTIMIRDYFLDESRTFPPEGAVFAVNMLVATAAGNSYTMEETREALEAVGFKDAKLIRDERFMEQVVCAVK
ncbi:methyltransferase [Thermodesulfobacteriota bacterium]